MLFAMGGWMIKDVGARFVQSAGDFPLSVGLGKKDPSWELKRWGRNILGFSPLVEGGYSTRGDRWRVHYAGDRVSHRFTILDNEHFEYDVILNKEPESNRLYLGVQGWEGFDFFRQPDDIGPDMLRGSYAVYKKEGVINAPAYHVGTGKLCHIHRPRIIDARGRRVWGDIWIDRGVMTMIIPEWWLAEAKYPVVVDPVVGSSVAGAYYTYEYLSQEVYEEDYLEDKKSDPSVQLDWYKEMYYIDFDTTAVFNKYKTPAQLQGTYNTYVYIEWIPVPYSYPSYEYDYRNIPVLYSDHNNKPRYLLNYNSTFGNPMANLSSPKNFTPRWVQSTMTINGSVTANTDVWFGFWARYGATRFDYAAPLFQTYEVYLDPDSLKDYGSVYEIAVDWDFYNIDYAYDRYTDEKDNVYPGARYDMKASMYLAIPASYTRTVTQWVMPTEVRKLTGQYQRNATQTALGTAETKRFEGFYRSMVQTIKNTVSLKGSPTLIRKVAEAVAALYEAKAGAGLNRGIGDTAGSEGVALRHLFVFLRLLTGAYIRDYIIGRFLKSKEELIIKSPVCREIVIDSKLH
jgi:hypothetical protein